ncbi:hypothetical protein [Pseudomonas nitroreducens]|uniref:hypothetical protein n=1 Tax=Pseudomonas nitroreducens TaxID=46680 RepID=UPI002D806BC4|nr:hypothetical protein [Pseudomonas nitroreducens]
MDQQASIFWMVWNPEAYAPSVRHPTWKSAEAEAERLARSNPGQRFYILQATQIRRVDYMQRIVLGGPFDDDHPF